MHDPFIAAIQTRPGDLALRLVHADWLCERGDPRGEFIQTQVQQSAELFGSRRWRELQSRSMEMLAEHGAEWFGALAELPLRRLEVRFGAVHTIELTGAAFSEHWQEIEAAAPLLEGLHICDAKGSEDAVGRLQSNTVRTLRLKFDVAFIAIRFGASRWSDPLALQSEAMIRSLATSRLRQLEELVLDGFHLNTRAATILAGIPWKLDSFGIFGDIEVAGLKSIVESPSFVNVRRFSARLNCGYEGASVVSQSQFLNKVQELRLTGQTFGPEGTQLVLDSASRHELRTLAVTQLIPPEAKNLETLAFYVNPIETLLDHPCIGNLRELELCGDELTSDEVGRLTSQAERLIHLGLSIQSGRDILPALAKSELSRRLHSLRVWFETAPEDEIPMLFDRSNWDELHVLELVGNVGWIHAASQLAQHPLRERLTILSIEVGTSGEQEAWRALVGSRPFPQLSALYLHGDLWRDEGEDGGPMDLLTRAESFPVVSHVQIRDCHPSWADRLANAPWFRRDAFLHIGTRQWPETLRNELCRKLGWRIRFDYVREAGPVDEWPHGLVTLSRDTVSAPPGTIILHLEP